MAHDPKITACLSNNLIARMGRLEVCYFQASNAQRVLTLCHLTTENDGHSFSMVSSSWNKRRVEVFNARAGHNQFTGRIRSDLDATDLFCYSPASSSFSSFNIPNFTSGMSRDGSGHRSNTKVLGTVAYRIINENLTQPSRKAITCLPNLE